MDGLAWFIYRPKDMDELRGVHALDAEEPYRVAAEITLEDIDFENFITDLYADREFLEEFAPVCSRGPVSECLLVRCEGERNGVLVVPEDECFVGWAAWTAVEP